MQPNEAQNHDHATTSMKVLLLVFAILLVGALGYMVYQQNTAPDETDYSTNVVKKSTTETTPVVTTEPIACGDTTKYGFELELDGTIWKNHTIKEVKPDYAIITCYFTMPTTSTETVWTAEAIDHAKKYSSIFAVSVYTPSQWTTALTEPNPSTELGHNTDYYWGWAPAQALPQDLQDSKISADVKNVVATFKISE